MSTAHYLPDAEFAPAPAGTRVRLATTLCAVVMALVTVVLAVMMMRDRHLPAVGFITLGVAPAVMILSWLASRIRCYRLTATELLVEFRFRSVRFPFAGLSEATLDREAMRRAWKLVGNDGLGAVSGRFRSRRLGAFRAYLTDTEHAIVLRWPDRCLVISPDQQSYFLETLRKRAGLPR